MSKVRVEYLCTNVEIKLLNDAKFMHVVEIMRL